jgi:hypothetical protein
LPGVRGSSLVWCTRQHLNGHTPDISVLLRFHLWQKVYYKKVYSHFPYDSVEAAGHIVGISDHCGHALTYKVFNPSTQKAIHRSLIRPADTSDPNLRVASLGGEIEAVTTPVIHSRRDQMLLDTKQPSTQYSVESTVTPIVNPEELIGRTFLWDKQYDGQQFRAQIVKLIDDHTSQLENNKDRIKIILSLDEDAREEVITYNQLLDYLARDNDNDIIWKFKRIISYQGPITSNQPDYNLSTYNLLIEWENGETTKEPFQVIAKDDPVTCAIYAKDNGLLDSAGWKQFKSIARRQRKFTRMVHQEKLKSFNNAPKLKNGYEI